MGQTELNPAELDQIKRVGIAAAYKSAHILTQYEHKIFKIDKKGANDLVTDADRESEKTIVNTITGRYPQHSILAEESGQTKNDSRYMWIIDPLDGTTNFAHKIPLYCISIAFSIDSEVMIGIILVPSTEQLFTAVKGQGAFLNDKPIFVSQTQTMADSLLATGFPYDFKPILSPLVSRFANCLSASRGVRRLGSAALDLCYVACGKFDAFWEQNLKPWDTAAGVLMVKEAGGQVTDFDNQPFELEKQELLATNSKIHQKMLGLLTLEEGE